MIEFEECTLENGLTLIHHYDKTTPFVQVNVLYKVGAKDELSDKTGFAHLFEHLMFGGSKNAPNFDAPLQEAGGSNNAFTNNDYTNYYDVVPAENLEVALFLEADRMSNLNINEKTLNVQKSVVIEEFKENYLNQPYGDVWHIIREMVYEQHAYKWPTIGLNIEHIEKAHLNDVQEFYNQHYTPSNAILTIAGNVSYDEALEKTKKYFENIEKKSNVKGISIKEPIQTNRKEKTVVKPVPISNLYMVFKMPGRMEKGYLQADVLTDVLSMGKTSRLYRRLVKTEKKALQVDAYISGSKDTGMLVIEAKLIDRVRPEEVEAIIWEEIDQLIRNGVEQGELQRIKNKLITYMSFSENDLMSRAIGLSYFNMLGSTELFNKQVEAYEDIESKEIVDFVKEYLRKDKCSVLNYLKLEK